MSEASFITLPGKTSQAPHYIGHVGNTSSWQVWAHGLVGHDIPPAKKAPIDATYVYMYVDTGSAPRIACWASEKSSPDRDDIVEKEEATGSGEMERKRMAKEKMKKEARDDGPNKFQISTTSRLVASYDKHGGERAIWHICADLSSEMATVQQKARCFLWFTEFKSIVLVAFRVRRKKTITGNIYLDMLELYMFPQIEDTERQSGNSVFYQQDGASSAQCPTCEVTKQLNRGGGPIPWPPRSPDLTPLDFFFWGYVKNIVYPREREWDREKERGIKERGIVRKNGARENSGLPRNGTDPMVKLRVALSAQRLRACSVLTATPRRLPASKFAKSTETELFLRLNYHCCLATNDMANCTALDLQRVKNAVRNGGRGRRLTWRRSLDGHNERLEARTAGGKSPTASIGAVKGTAGRLDYWTGCRRRDAPTNSQLTAAENFKIEPRDMPRRFANPLKQASPNTKLQSQHFIPTVKHGGGSVMVWGCVASSGVKNLTIIEGAMDSIKYISVLRLDISNSAQKLGLAGVCVFQQDYDPKHTTMKTKEWLFYNAPRRILTLPQSPYVNPIEQLWEYLGEPVQKHHPSSKRAQQRLILQVSFKITPAHTTALVRSMPRRTKLVNPVAHRYYQTGEREVERSTLTATYPLVTQFIDLQMSCVDWQPTRAQAVLPREQRRIKVIVVHLDSLNIGQCIATYNDVEAEIITVNVVSLTRSPTLRVTLGGNGDDHDILSTITPEIQSTQGRKRTRKPAFVNNHALLGLLLTADTRAALAVPGERQAMQSSEHTRAATPVVVTIATAVSACIAASYRLPHASAVDILSPAELVFAHVGRQPSSRRLAAVLVAWLPGAEMLGFTRRFHTLSSIHASKTSLAYVPQSPVVQTSLHSCTLDQADSVKDCRPLGCGSINSVLGRHLESSPTHVMRRGWPRRQPVSPEHSCVVVEASCRGEGPWCRKAPSSATTRPPQRRAGARNNNTQILICACGDA
ncbi:hypothetical protein PR048_029138 [Dryococelus australis]|uniref:Uncharacterized protein n=1 Tax=Dryococelus australis TaxID=614101 RepID=A0ABQ9GCL8_9NEOP|nr:hypothetical protein PR048_029138 [Dryococelus australis]